MLLGKHSLPIQQIVALDSTLPSVPPSPTYLPLMGKLTLNIKLEYLNLPFDKNFDYRYALWGSSNKIYFLNNKTELKITASIESLSKYFWDMNALCVEVLSLHQVGNDIGALSKKTLGRTEKDLLQKDKKVVGYVFIPLRKYFVNNVMNSFAGEKFVVVDQSKKRIGELTSQLKIQMLSNNGLEYKQYLSKQNHHQTEHSLASHNKQLSRERDDISLVNQMTAYRLQQYQGEQVPKKKKVTISDHNKVINEVEYRQGRNDKRQTQKSLVQNKYMKKNYFSHENIYLGTSENHILGDTDEEEMDNEEESKAIKYQGKSIKISQNRSYSKKKKTDDLEEYLKKPEHTALSMIKMKYGLNHPALELMKLRLDQVQYIDKQASIADQTDTLINQSGKFSLKFLIHSISIITGRSTVHPKSLTISSLNHNNKLLTRTQLNLQSLPKLSNQVIQLNSVVVCNNVEMSDRVVIETADAFEEVSVKEFVKQGIVDLRKKDNKKRTYEIRYEVWHDQLQNDKDYINKDVSAKLTKNQSSKQKKHRIRSRSPQFGTKQKVILKKTKQINNIINNNYQSHSKNKPPKQKPAQIIAQRQNGQRAPSQSIKSPYHKLLKQSSDNFLDFNNKGKQNQFTVEELVSGAIMYFQLLYRCEDENCLAIVNRLLAKSNKDMMGSQRDKLYSKLQTILIGTEQQKSSSEQIISIQTIVNRLFEDNFNNFYKTFTSYKQINLKYATTLYKLSKLLHFYQQPNKGQSENQYSELEKIYGILDYIKKYKRQHISFGLIRCELLKEIIRQKYVVTETQNQQLNSRLQSQPAQKEQQLQQQPKKQNQQEQIKPSQLNQLLQLIQGLLILFSRHQGQFIKISQLQQFISHIIKNHKSQNLSTGINLNMNLLILLYQEVVRSQSKPETQINEYEEFIKSPMFEFISQYIKELNSFQYAKSRVSQQQQQEENKNQLTLYKLIYKDILSLSDLKSSIHLSLLNSQHFSQRLKTSSHQHNRLKTQEQINIQKHSRNYSQKKRLNTEEMSLNINQKKRLNTQDINLIDLVNEQKKMIEEKNVNNDREKERVNREEEMIGIQITKRQQFRKLQEQKQLDEGKEQADVREQKKQQNQAIQNQVIKKETPQTKYISIKCTLINPFANHLTNKKTSYPYQKQPIQAITLFYQHKYSSQQEDKKGDKLQEYKIEARSYDSRQTIVPNTFSVIEGSKQPIQQLQFRLENIHPNNPSIIRVKNTIGRQQYAIQNHQGQLSFILQVQIQSVNQQKQQQYLEEQMLKQKQQNQQFQTDKYSQLFMLNVNKVVCLDLVETDVTFRVIYEKDGEVVAVRDVGKININHGDDSNQIQKSRVIPLDTQFIDIQPSFNNQQKHILKIIKLQSTLNNQHQHSRPTQPNPNNKPPTKLKHSHPINRSYQNRQQSTLTSIKQGPLELLAQFQFIIQVLPRKDDRYGIRKERKWLVSDKFRLEVDLVEVKYEKWQKNHQDQSLGNKQFRKSNENQQIWNKKILKIMNVLNHQNQQTIRNHYHSYKKVNQSNDQTQNTSQSFIQLISSCMKYRLTQRQIFTSLCFINPKQPSQPLQQEDKLLYLKELFGIDLKNSIDLQKSDKRSSVKNLLTLYEEFETFDLQHTGSLTPFKYEVIKKVIPQLTALQSTSFLVGKSNIPLLKHLTQTQTIKDAKLSSELKKNIDYLKILWSLRNAYKDDFFNIQSSKTIPQSAKPQQNKFKQEMARKQQQSQLKKNKYDKEVDLSWENEEYEPEYRKQTNKKPNKVAEKQVDQLLKRQFYEQDQSDQQQLYHKKKPVSTNKKDQQFIGQSVLSALNNQSHQKHLPLQLENRIKGSRQENLLSQTRQQWQKIKNTSQNNKDELVEDNNELSMMNVLKKEIDKDELEKKFTAIKHMDFSSSDSNDEDE